LSYSISMGKNGNCWEQSLNVTGQAMGGVSAMLISHNRVRPASSLEERLLKFAEEARAAANLVVPGREHDQLLRKALKAESLASRCRPAGRVIALRGVRTAPSMGHRPERAMLQYRACILDSAGRYFGPPHEMISGRRGSDREGLAPYRLRCGSLARNPTGHALARPTSGAERRGESRGVAQWPCGARGCGTEAIR